MSEVNVYTSDEDELLQRVQLEESDSDYGGGNNDVNV